jgi:hypothetical protein
MVKSEELQHSSSCLNRADADEMVFVLLARDICAPVAIRAWVEARIACGKNQRTDGQIIEALQCAERMQEQYLQRTLTRMQERSNG